MAYAGETILALLAVAIAASALILGTIYFVLPALRDRRREPDVRAVEGSPSRLPGGQGYLPPSPNLEPESGRELGSESGREADQHERPEQRRAG